MELTRRKLLHAGAWAAVAGSLAGASASAGLSTAGHAPSRSKAAERERQVREAQPSPLPAAFDTLAPLGERIQPITVAEFQARIAHAQRLMTDRQPRFDALYLAPGTSLYYFTGIRWGLSERAAGAVIPRSGNALLFCPAFEESRYRELMRWPLEVRVWQEDQNPGALVANWLAERGVRSGLLAINETTPYTYFDQLSRAASAWTFALADPITAGCRAQKSEHELELMRLACAATIDVYRAIFASVQVGMTQYDVSSWYTRGLHKMGLPGDEGLVLVGKWAAQPHGTTVPQQLQEGEVLLIDAGTSVEGYASDITRATVMGKPSDKLERAFDTLRQAQDRALEALRAGHLTGSVDDAARAVVVGAGYGPDYKYFAHRLGHGIGLDGHEHPYLVRGSKDVLQPGMTFSNEPGIYIAGDFGLRLEDDMVVMPDGPGHLLTPSFSPSLAKPCG
jgi:Xaa-Pro dipeptidase